MPDDRIRFASHIANTKEVRLAPCDPCPGTRAVTHLCLRRLALALLASLGLHVVLVRLLLRSFQLGIPLAFACLEGRYKEHIAEGQNERDHW